MTHRLLKGYYVNYQVYLILVILKTINKNIAITSINTSTGSSQLVPAQIQVWKISDEKLLCRRFWLQWIHRF